MTRLLLLLLAITTGIYALTMWICGELTDAGIAAATSAAAVLMAEFAAFCQRRQWSRGREDVWARRVAEEVRISYRDGYPYYFLPKPTDTEERGAMWPHEAGSFE